MKIFLILLAFKMIISEIITKQNIEKDNQNILSKKAETYIPYLNVTIEYINYYEITDAKFTIISPVPIDKQWEFSIFTYVKR